jgi:chromosomal replication initiator protein
MMEDPDDAVDPGPNRDRAAMHMLLQQILTRVRRDQFEPWFRSLVLVRFDECEVEISVTSQFVRDWLLKNYLATIQESVTAAVGGKRRIVLTLREEDGHDNLRLMSLQPAMQSHPAGIPAEGAAARSGTEAPSPPSSPPAGPATGSAAGVASGASSLRSPSPSGHGSGTGGAFHGPTRAPSALLQSSSPAVPGQVAARRLRPAHLNSNYTFERFVVGPCNRLAHASALAIGENPGCAYNPLFVHGNVGLGKSHLLQAICHTVMRRDPGARVLYLSCEDFTNTFINAIQNGSLDDFRNFHRNVDVLVIDDVQFLANKEKTQDEFFHTFNSLYDAQKQIVMSSDRSPLEIPTIEGRLVSRFKWGLVAEIEAPCYETRVAIVRRKAKGRGIDLSDEVAQFIAERITVNIRELEGAVIKVVGVAAITGRRISCELAEEALRGIAAVRHAQVSADDVMNLITTEFAISARDLTGKSRTQAVSLPRQIAMFLLRGHTELSLEDIGRFFGNRDHTTVLYAVTKIRDRSQKDRMFKELLEGLSNRLVARGFR